MARMDMSMDGVILGPQTVTPDALFELGILYATGRDIEPDLVAAHKWFNLAAMRGNEFGARLPPGGRPRDVGEPDRRGAEGGSRMAGHPMVGSAASDHALAL